MLRRGEAKVRTCTLVAAAALMFFASTFFSGRESLTPAQPVSHPVLGLPINGIARGSDQYASSKTRQHLFKDGIMSTRMKSNAIATSGQQRPLLNGSLEAALLMAVPPGQLRFLLLTFGNKGVLDHLLNFVDHVRSVGAAHIVGAVDNAVFELLRRQATPVYKTPLANEAYHMDGSNQHSSSSWKKFAGMRTVRPARNAHTVCSPRRRSLRCAVALAFFRTG